ncbi:MAG: DUF885 domain-containing protein [Lachnospiraceae bacterium]|nr:DUF885 domain-containing protein [Lachnospiraceae bacterium]
MVPDGQGSPGSDSHGTTDESDSRSDADQDSLTSGETQPAGGTAKEGAVPAPSDKPIRDISPAKAAFDELCDDFLRKQMSGSTINLHFSLRYPERFGISVGGEGFPITFGEYSLEEMRRDLDDYRAMRERLDAIPPGDLSDDDRLAYEIFAVNLDNALALEGFELYENTLGPTIGLQAQLPILLAEYAFYDRQDIDHYIALVGEIDDLYAQILEMEKLKAQQGLFMSDGSVDLVIASCMDYLTDPEDSILVQTFPQRLDQIPGLTPSERGEYEKRNLQAVTDSFLPAYRTLADGLAQLKGSGTNDGGVCLFADGKAYYEKLLADDIAPSYKTVDDLKAAIEEKMGEDARMISELLGNNPDLADEWDSYAFSTTDPMEILDTLREQAAGDFPPLPECNYTVKYVPEALRNVLSPAFYLTPPIDFAESNTIYINSNPPDTRTDGDGDGDGAAGDGSHNGESGAPSAGESTDTDSDLFVTLAHEGYPGHLLQTVYFFQSTDSTLRKLLSSSSYSEGWAFYVELYAYGLDNGLSKQLGQVLAHESSLSLGLHALLELNINYYGWTKDEVSDYLSEVYGVLDPSVVSQLYYTMAANPTNYMEYYAGYLEIADMQATAQKRLRNRYDALAFHTFLLDIGPAPFPIIRERFRQWLADAR